MQQSIQLMQLRDELGKTYCLIQVQDVTAIGMREQALRERAEALRNFAYMDALTGVANRRCFEEELERTWKGSRRNGKSLGLLMIDVDHFKSYNDCLGHQAGDHCLARVAEVLKQALHRPEDMVARYGGEEFAVLLPYTDLAGCREIARKMLDQVTRMSIPHPESAYGVVTISIGLSSQLNENDRPAEELVRDADVALYRAKLEGRNRFSG
jgi:diguanylate cyclase (GGDEF)-like protein